MKTAIVTDRILVWSPSLARSAREAAGLSQSDAARRIGCHRNNLRQYEGAERSAVPSVNRALRMASVYGCSLEDLAEPAPPSE